MIGPSVARLSGSSGRADQEREPFDSGVGTPWRGHDWALSCGQLSRTHPGPLSGSCAWNSGFELRGPCFSSFRDFPKLSYRQISINSTFCAWHTSLLPHLGKECCLGSIIDTSVKMTSMAAGVSSLASPQSAHTDPDDGSWPWRLGQLAPRYGRTVHR